MSFWLKSSSLSAIFEGRQPFLSLAGLSPCDDLVLLETGPSSWADLSLCSADVLMISFEEISQEEFTVPIAGGCSSEVMTTAFIQS
jgi:hypothetical protein